MASRRSSGDADLRFAVVRLLLSSVTSIVACWERPLVGYLRGLFVRIGVSRFWADARGGTADAFSSVSGMLPNLGLIMVLRDTLGTKFCYKRTANLPRTILERCLLIVMYITYTTPQQVLDPHFTDSKTTGGEYRPIWLIRTSDWKKVSGIKAVDGYCALSYCWEQSGEMFQAVSGDYDLEDGGCHCIETKTLERRKSRRSVRFRRKTHSKRVTYETVLQQICKDFDIDYLWYDKICINQTNKAEKLREIKQMHRIYSNARYTMAIVPEIYIANPKDFVQVDWLTNRNMARRKTDRQFTESLWWKRSWTLEELMMSTRLLVVGRNTHFWSLARREGDKAKEFGWLSTSLLGFKDRGLIKANIALSYAHFRTSTKEHDKVFALANIFDGIISIDFDYDSKVSDVIHTFYQRLIQCDLSVLCFGSDRHFDVKQGRIRPASTMADYNLPSWTGVDGVHSNLPITDIVLDNYGSYYIDNDMRLHLSCRSYTIRPVKYDDYGAYFNAGGRGQQAELNFKKIVTCADDLNGDKRSVLDWGQWCMDYATSCLGTHYWVPDQQSFYSPILPLSLATDCDECVMLALLFVSAEMVFDKTRTGNFTAAEYNYYYLLPVLKKSTESSMYKSIGIILLKPFRAHEARMSPKEFLQETFGNLCEEIKEFIIE